MLKQAKDARTLTYVSNESYLRFIDLKQQLKIVVLTWNCLTGHQPNCAI